MKNSEAKKEVNEDIKVISLNEYHEMKPKSFEPNSVLNFLTFLETNRDKAEILFDEVKDQADSVFDYVTLQKFNNKTEKLSY